MAKIKSEVVEYAWLMHETGSDFSEVRCFTRSQEAYFATLDDEESVDEKRMFEFIERTTELGMEKARKIGYAQLKSNTVEITPEEENLLVSEMLKKMDQEDRESAGMDFVMEAYNYI